jgi:outer membrane lipoprotein carrier protein
MQIGSDTRRTLPFPIVRLQSRQGCGRPGAVAALLVVTLLGAVNGELAGRDLFDELYARGQQQNAGLKTLTAAFTETSTSSLLTKPLVARGTVYVERPARVVLRYSDPDERIILIDGDRMSVSWPAAKLRSARDIGAAQRRIQRYFVDSSPKELRSHFDIAAREAEDRPGTYYVTMVPRRTQIQEGMTRLELWLDRTTLLLAAMRMTFPGGDTKLLTFADVRPNAPIAPAIFKIPEGPGL